MRGWLQGNDSVENKIRRAGELGRGERAVGVFGEIDPERVASAHGDMNGRSRAGGQRVEERRGANPGSAGERPGLDTALAGKQPAGSYATAAQGAKADTASQPGHTHSTSQITGLDTALATKITGTGVTSLEVVQSLPATLVPTTFYILIPSGATAATSVQLGSIPLFTGSGGGGGGGGTPDTLPTIAGLQLRLDASFGTYDSITGNTAVANNGLIARWEDRSGNSRHALQYTLNSRPKLIVGGQNGKNIINFDGLNDFIDVSSLNIPQPFTIVAAWVPKDLSFGSYLFDKTNSSNRVAIGYNATGSTADRGKLFYYSGGPAASQHQVDSTNQKLVTTNVFNGSNGFMRKNGSVILQSTSTSDNGSSALESLRFGARFDPSNFGNLDIYEFLVYDSQLSTQNIQALESYLNTKWGIM